MTIFLMRQPAAAQTDFPYAATRSRATVLCGNWQPHNTICAATRSRITKRASCAYAATRSRTNETAKRTLRDVVVMRRGRTMAAAAAE